MLQRAGFFHFAQSHCDPLAELAKAIDTASRAIDVADSLIVLPEAFNLGREYGSGDTPKMGPQLDHRCVLADLRTLATMHKASFITSVIEEGSRNNSAYFVDAGPPRLMCHKIIDDGYEEYSPCTADCEAENPLNHGETQIGVLVWADAFDNRKGQGAAPGAQYAYRRRQCLLSRLVKVPRCLLCVPAYTYLDPDLPGVGLILANSRPGHRSFVKNWKGGMVGTPNDLHKNEVCLRDLSLIVENHIGPV